MPYQFPLLPAVLTVFLYLSSANASCLAAEPERETWRIAEMFEVEPVWSGHRVGMSLLTAEDRQYVAYYDADRRMSVASRALGSDEWQIKKLPTSVGWDSHNSVTMALDRDGNLHVSGNMHCVPLIYFRTTTPGDVSTLTQFTSMVGDHEKRCTYPHFLYGNDGELIYIYRDGGSGNGMRLWNVYDETTRAWRRLIDTPVFSGEGKRNAYYVGPVRDAKGTYHMVWVWRDTPDCATNHDLSYARTDDLTHWTKSDGTPLELPMTLDTAEIVDPVPVKGGLINGNTKIGFDKEGRGVLSYHKYDAEGKTQIYNAWLEEKGWAIYRTTDWDYRWEFSGGGCIGFEVSVGPVQVDALGRLVQHYRNPEEGGLFELDEETLKQLRPVQPTEPRMPPEITRKTSTFPGMLVRVQSDLADSQGHSGRTSEDRSRYVLRWESRGVNRDRPFEGPIPPPSRLRVYKLILGDGKVATEQR